MERAIRTAYEEEPWRVIDILNAHGGDQTKCKEYLIDHMPIMKKGIVLGGWYGKLADMLGYISIDIDPKCEYYGKMIYPYTTFYTDDAFNHLCTTEYDMVVNTACEHMAQDDLDMFNHMSGTWFALQSNNWEGKGGHINCKESLDEFVSDYNFDVFFTGELDMGEYKRWTLVGQAK